MRTLTTDWNNASYASATSFTCRTSGKVITIAAANPTDVRSMQDSVNAGTYATGGLNALVALPATDATAPEATTTVTCTLTTSGAVAIAGLKVSAASDDVSIVTVSPAFTSTNGSGQAVFVITSVAAGVGTVTFTCGATSDTTVVTCT